jgi:hypothetical protein
MSSPGQQESGLTVLTDLWRTVELCLPSHQECGAITFRPRGEETFVDDWHAWLAGLRAPILREAFLGLHCQASGQSFMALLGGDAALGAALPESAARASLAEGRRALLGSIPPRGAKLIERLREAAAANERAGHLAAVFAVRAQAFHIPAVQAEMALVLAECIFGAASVGLTLPAARSAELMVAASASATAPAQLVAV